MYIEYPMIGKHPASIKVFEAIEEAARNDDPLLITGETGTGKELIANAVQRQSRRGQQAYLRINCTELHHERFATELFGKRLGTKKRKSGFLRDADGGTLLLDEIESLPIPMQAKLLNLIEGMTSKDNTNREGIGLDVRLIAVSNADLQQRAERGKFSVALYEQLSIERLHAPALRERKTDIPMLIGYYLGIMSKHYAADCPRLAKDTLDMLMTYPWPGNIRELRNVCENLVVRRLQSLIRPKDLPFNPNDACFLFSDEHALTPETRASHRALNVILGG